MSVARGLAQPLTRNLVAISSTIVYNGANLLAQFTAANGNQQIGSLVVAPTFTVLLAAVEAANAGTTAAAASTLTDVGKTITLTVNDGANNNSSIKLREVKFQAYVNSGNSAVPFITGYVVVENSFNTAATTSADLKVTVARV